ncbi:ABC transporter ATP-binding protein [Laceyella sacchari]|jgi:ABC-2 type transport system ATP-binding protein|uniref:ABC transporter ATP-binding protein n=1 Tax=Laceyella sacchari TaxID=37482 RepID=A0ABY5U6P8_LACSH|nr:ABC transporter ATP-binding protein [Laceyella sacchari]TCW41100.1 ABC-2 type transport system ATP-binding protein [Laceyella sacchari]UWE04690.1 ABC transporter ATP-binding protein [Laceyella sacchari]
MKTNHDIVLSVEDLGKKIGKREIVRHISFDVKEGEIFGFLGPNGAGKTTTIRMLVGLIKPTSGTVRICGHSLSADFMNAIRHVGCIVENPELYPYLSGRENLEHFARMLPDIPSERIDEVVDLVELTSRIDDLVKTYSLGMRQRLGIAQALLGNPKLLILDEPTNGLDPAGIRELRMFIRRLAKEKGISVFISSHILHEVQLMCDRVAIINQGTIVQTAAVQDMMQQETLVEWELQPATDGRDRLGQLPYVSRVELREPSKVIAQMPRDKIAEANAHLTGGDIQVSGIRTHQPTLEDIFLELTGGPAHDETHL